MASNNPRQASVIERCGPATRFLTPTPNPYPTNSTLGILARFWGLLVAALVWCALPSFKHPSSIHKAIPGKAMQCKALQYNAVQGGPVWLG